MLKELALTTREIALITISSCTFFAIGFLIAAYRRIFKDTPKIVRDYIDWSKIPNEYEWVAVDNAASERCNVFAFKKEPYISKVIEDPQTWLWTDGGFVEAMDAIIGTLPPWRESLRRRPS